ncbi:hypothetical protein [Anaerotignum sp.]|uniref:hypothetical protein n=1 Tax=Anaerotignum sp. TaxID=2039241 RepID=UPI0027148B98|nr:hypothetical protein [Anaerotignum sp.]
MAYEILKSIVEAEERAGQIIKQATEDAEALKKDAQKQREVLLQQVQQQGKELMQLVAKQADEESRVEIQNIQKDTENACLKIREQAAQKKEDAVQAVIGRVVGAYGSR